VDSKHPSKGLNMLKNLARLEHKVGDRVYHLLCDNDSPIVEVKDALTQFLGYAVQVEKMAAEAKQAAETPPEEPKPE